MTGIATIRASIFQPLLHELDRKNRDAGGLLAAHGLSRRHLEDPYAAVPIARYIAFFEGAARLLDDQTLGLRLGSSIKPVDLGPLGLLFSAAPTLRKAFARMFEFVSVLQGATQAGMQRQEDFTSLIYQIEDPAIWPRAQDSELTVAGICRLSRFCVGSSWRPLEVHFEHDEPPHRAALERFFQAPIRFGQPTNRVLVSNADFDRPFQIEDRGLSLILERHVRDLLAERRQEADIVQGVEKLIGLSLGQEPVTIERLAADLRISPRTLQRRLQQAGTSVRQLLRAHRRTMAEARIASPHISQEAIAHGLGYSDGTAFWRAFKGWTGTTPTEFRRRSVKG
ncbi:MAG TPA: AraC family transcriptional regulator [Aliidongia sp.]|nr:AraC family transcriptional regulator [Aliidongia sp.]